MLAESEVPCVLATPCNSDQDVVIESVAVNCSLFGHVAPGDVLLLIDGQPVCNTSTASARLREGAKLRLTVSRKRRSWAWPTGSALTVFICVLAGVLLFLVIYLPSAHAGAESAKRTEALNERVKSLQRAYIDSLRRARDRGSKDSDSLQMEQRNSSQHAQHLRLRIERLNEDRAYLLLQQRNSSLVMNKLRSQVANLRGKYDVLLKDRDSLGKDRDHLQIEQKNGAQALQRLRSQLAGLRKAHGGLLKDLDSVSKDRDSVGKDRDSLLIEQRNSSLAVQQLHSSIDSLRKDHESLLKSHDQLQRHMGNAENTRMRQLWSLTLLLHETQRKLKSLEALNATHRHQITRLRSMLNLSAEIESPAAAAVRTHVRLGVVQHTHTMAAAPSLERAARQLSEWNQHRSQHEPISFMHHVVLWADEPSWCPLWGAKVALFTENVSCATSKAVARALPALGSTYRYRGTGSHTNDLKRSTYNQEWSWNACDAPFLWWFRDVAHSACDYYWVFEWDLAWRGNLPAMLAAFHGRSFVDGDGTRVAGSNRDEDLLCDFFSVGNGAHGAVTKRNAHLRKRNASHFPFPVLRQCSQQIVRMSRRLAERVTLWSQRSQAYIFCEMRAASMCAMEESLESSVGNTFGERACLSGDIRDGPQERFFDVETFNWVANVHEVITRGALENASAGSQFYHRYKWGGTTWKGRSRVATVIEDASPAYRRSVMGQGVRGEGKRVEPNYHMAGDASLES